MWSVTIESEVRWFGLGTAAGKYAGRLHKASGAAQPKNCAACFVPRMHELFKSTDFNNLNINCTTSDVKYTLNVNSHVTVRRRSFKVSVSTMPRRSMVGGGDLSSCNSSSGPTWLTDSCIGSAPARCHGIEAIERHELPHSYPSWVHPLLDELQQASPRCRSISQKERCPKSHLLSYRPCDMPLSSRPGKACGEIFRLRDDNMLTYNFV